MNNNRSRDRCSQIAQLHVSAHQHMPLVVEGKPLHQHLLLLLVWNRKNTVRSQTAGPRLNWWENSRNCRTVPTGSQVPFQLHSSPLHRLQAFVQIRHLRLKAFRTNIRVCLNLLGNTEDVNFLYSHAQWKGHNMLCLYFLSKNEMIKQQS